MQFAVPQGVGESIGSKHRRIGDAQGRVRMSHYIAGAIIALVAFFSLLDVHAAVACVVMILASVHGIRDVADLMRDRRGSRRNKREACDKKGQGR